MEKPFPCLRHLAWLLLLTSSVVAQIPMSAGSYSQNFDSLVGASASLPWTNGVTLPGWYASKTSSPHDVTNYNLGTGSSTAGALYCFRLGGAGDGALGSVASSGPGDLAYGLRFTNDTGFHRTNLTVSFTGEQWRVAKTERQKLTCWYRIGTGLTNADAAQAQYWTAVPALDFISPNTNATQALNGNLATNRVAFTNVALEGIVVPPGYELFLRWLDVDDSPGSDDGLALDDLSVNFGDGFVPMPDTNHAFSLLTYNVKGNGATDWSTNTPQVQAIARVLQHLHPDVITFQEIPFDLSYEMTNFMAVYLPGYALAQNSGTDGSIRAAVASRFPINRSTSWLDGMDLRSFGYSNANNSLDNFTRDLFEAEITVPGFPQPLHVFTTHLKSTGTNYADSAAKRAAETSAITNFLATNLLAKFPLRPYVLTGDMNESDTNALAIQKLISTPAGLRLTHPTNAATGSINTFSIRASVSERIDYILPNALLGSNIYASQVFRSDRLNPQPAELGAEDSAIASDHLPVLMIFDNPYTKPFRITSISAGAGGAAVTWPAVPGQFYQVEASANLMVWQALAPPLTATNGQPSFVAVITNAAGFFRVRQGL
ncbi:MAG: endonuclease/exonuclease/phosphatase family protein [Verrucomicrobiota bacterium]